MEKTAVIKRLDSFGYAYKEDEDAFSLEFATDKVENHIRHKTNQDDIPEGLNNVAIDMICAEFLNVKKGFGQLTDYDFESIAQSIKLGDASVQLSNDATPEQKFDAVVGYLLNGHDEDFVRYRRMVW